MTFEKRIIDLDPSPPVQNTDLFETSRGGTGSFKILYSDIKLDLQSTLYTAGTGIDITAGIISAIPMSSETLQSAYDNGSPGIKGRINLSNDESFRLVGIDAAFCPPSMTGSEFTAITTKFDGMLCFGNDLERYITYSNGVENLISYISDIDQTNYGEMYFNNNSLSTNIIAAGNPVKINATYSTGLLNLFSHSAGALTYFGELRNFKINVNLTCTLDLVTGDISIFVYKNGLQISKSKQSVYVGPTTPAKEPISCQCMIDLTNSDYIEVFVQNDLSTDPVTVTQFNCIVSSMLSL